jgi:hypothetical protein
VPGLTDGVDDRYGCPRCGAVLLNDSGIDLTTDLDALRAAKAQEIAAPPLNEPASSAEPAEKHGQPVFEPVRPPQTEPSRVTTLRWDAANWELNEKLRHVERLTTIARRRHDGPTAAPMPVPHENWSPAAPTSLVPPSNSPAPHSLHGAAPFAPTWPQAYAAPPHPGNPYAPAAPYESPYAPQPADDEDDEPAYYEHNADRGGAGRLFAVLVSWLFLGGAVTAFSCGGFLAAWGGLNERPAVQQLGMPVVLLGMLSLVIGLLPQIFLRRLEEQRDERIVVQRSASRRVVSGRPRRATHQMSRAPSSTGR